MKVTVDLPDELYKKAKVLALDEKTTFREVLIQSLEQFFQSGSSTHKPVESSTSLSDAPSYAINEAGFIVYNAPDRQRKISKEFIQHLRNELGV